MTNRNFCVYKHTSPDGLIYIGITGLSPSERWINGKGYKRNARFYSDIQCYGWDAFKHEILADSLTEDEALEIEAALIKSHDATNPKIGYNIRPGGNKSPMTDAAKQANREKAKAQWQDPVFRKKAIDGMRGAKRSALSRENISKAQKERYKNEDQRRAISERQKGKKRSEEAKKKTSESLLAFYSVHQNLEKLKQKRAVSNKASHAVAIICLDTGEVFDAIVDAAEKYQISHQNITKVCKGERPRAGGKRWAYFKKAKGKA